MSGKNYKKCRYCQKNYAKSKEHIIVNSRLDSINKFKNLTQRNDNIKKTYKNITCMECNHILGEYESKNWICLANATIWKILAGNTNNAFEGDSEYILQHSDERCIKNFENALLTVIKSKNLALRDNTFTFNIDHKTIDSENKPGKSIMKYNVKCADESGRPLKGVRIYMFQNNANLGYEWLSNDNGEVPMTVLAGLEMVKIVSEKLTIQNQCTAEKIYKDLDIIIYVSLGPGNHRILVMLPLKCPHMYYTGWPNTRLAMFLKKKNLRIVQDHISDIRIIDLKQIWDSEHSNPAD